jgi:hypothetical protein
MRANIPEEITSMTGREYQLFASRKSFGTKMTTFGNRLQSRYLLSFATKGAHARLHEIHVRLRERQGHRALKDKLLGAKAR